MTVSYTHLDVYKRQALCFDHTLIRFYITDIKKERERYKCE